MAHFGGEWRGLCRGGDHIGSAEKNTQEWDGNAIHESKANESLAVLLQASPLAQFCAVAIVLIDEVAAQQSAAAVKAAKRRKLESQ